MHAVRVVVNLEPRMFGELLARALAEPLADVEVRLDDDPDATDHPTVLICDERASGEITERGEVVVRLRGEHEREMVISIDDRASATRSGELSTAQFADLGELIDLLRELTASRS